MNVRAALYAHVREWAQAMNASFWLRPTLIVAASIGLADLLIDVGHWWSFEKTPLSNWLYNGGEQGARTLLGTIAGSAIGVAGTTFAITITTLTLASQQMGPRMLRNFTEDHGNQATLGVFLGTFAYAVEVLGSVRGTQNNIFVPHLAITGAILMALLSVLTLIYFVHHIASRIDLDVQMEVVTSELERSIAELSFSEPPPPPAPPDYWQGARDVQVNKRGYVQFIDEPALADWAQEQGAAIQILVRPGDFYFPGTRLACVVPPGRDPGAVLERSITFGIYPTLSMDLEFSVSQLVDIALRALSPALNDPHTAMRVLDHLGAALCRLAGRSLSAGTIRRNGRVVYQRKATDYQGLTDAMFHLIRQSAANNAGARIHLVEVLAKVAEVERDAVRLDILERHGELMRQDAAKRPANDVDAAAFGTRYDWLKENLIRSRAQIR